MNPWDVLGIKPTTDRKTIKKAYAIQLKLYNPEDDAEGFMNVRAAYEKALEDAKYLKHVENEEIVESLANESTLANQEVAALKYEEHGSVEEIAEENILEDFMVKVDRLYRDFHNRINPKNWESLLSNEAYEDMDNNQVISLNLLNFLTNNYNIPNSVWRVMENRFFWSERKELYEIFPSEFIDFVVGRIYNTWGLRYDFFVEDENCNYDDFIPVRYEVYRLLINNQLEDIEENIEAAKKIFDNDPDLIRMEGQYYIRKGENDKAIKVFSKLIEVNPLEIDGYINRAVLLERKGEYKKAYYDYQKVLEIDKNHVRALSGLAEYYLRIGGIKEAKFILEEALLENLANTSLRIRLGEINYEIVNQIEKEFCEEININNGYELAKFYFDREDYERSEEILNELIENNIVSSEVYKLLGLILVEDDNNEEAIRWFNKGIVLEYEEGKNGYELLKLRGKSYLEVEEYDSAITDFVCLQKINPNDHEVLYNLAECYSDIDEDHKALKFINNAIDMYPHNWEYYSTRASIYYYLDRFKKAKKDYEIVIKHEYEYQTTWAMKAHCHLMTGEYEIALECYEKACGLGDIVAYHYYHLAVLYLKFDNGKKAHEYIKKYFDEEQEDYLGYILLGDICRFCKFEGYVEDAIEFYEKACELNEDEYIVYYILAYTYLDNEMYNEAITNFAEIIGECYDDEEVALDALWACTISEDWENGRECIEIYNDLIKRNKIEKHKSAMIYSGIILYNLGEYEEAIKQIQLYLEEELSGEAYSYLSMIYFELEDVEKAIEYGEKAIELDSDNVCYMSRLKQIEDSRNKKGFLGIFKKKSNKIKWVKSEIKPQHIVNKLPKINVTVGDEDE